MNVREPIEPKKPNNKRSRTTGNVKHKQGDARRSAGKRKLPVRKAKSSTTLYLLMMSWNGCNNHRNAMLTANDRRGVVNKVQQNNYQNVHFLVA